MPESNFIDYVKSCVAVAAEDTALLTCIVQNTCLRVVLMVATVVVAVTSS